MMDIKDVLKKWNEQFPILKRYTKQGLFLKTEFLLIGLSFGRDRFGGSEYGISLETYPLWQKDKLNWPMCYLNTNKEMFIAKGFSIDSRGFSLEATERPLENIIEGTKLIFGNVLTQQISLQDIVNHQFDFYEYYELFKLNPLYEQNLFELLFAIAMYYEDSNIFEETERRLRRRLKKWNTKHFEALFRMSKKQWLDELLERFSDRDRFMSIINENQQNPKVMRLNEAHIIYEPIVLKELPDIPIMERIKMYLRRKLGEAWI